MNKLKYLVWIVSLSFFTRTHAQDLEGLYQLAVDNNSQLKSLQLNYEAKLLDQEKVQLPFPQVGIGVPILRPETRLGGQVINVSYTQMFPWFGALKAEKEVFIAMAKSEYEKIATQRLDIFYQIESAYYQLILIEKKRATYMQSLKLFGGLEQLALSSVESGKTTIVDVLQIQTKKVEINQALALLINESKVHLATLQEITNQAQLLIELPLIMDSIAEINYDEAKYKDLIIQFHPMYQQLEANINASIQLQKENTKNALPSIGLGLNYSLVAERTDAFPLNNGQDILIPSIMISMPIYRKNYRVIDEQESLKQEQFNFEKEYLFNKILNLLKVYKANYDNAVLNIQFINEKITLTKSTQQVLLSAYSSSGKDFDELLKIQNQLILYQLDIEKAIIETYIERAKINQFTKI